MMKLQDLIYPLKNKFHPDERGTLLELFRTDWFKKKEIPIPKMSYISWTKPGKIRGPHEHKKQTDVFVFLDGIYNLVLFNPSSTLEEVKEQTNEYSEKVGKDNPVMAVVPPGIIHGYKNVGEQLAYVLNFPSELYAGENYKEGIDEIRHEDNPNMKFW